MAGKIRVIDFSACEEPGFVGGKRTPKTPVLMTRKQIKARVRRRGSITEAEFNILYKPLAEWDPEELARGRPRNKRGDFRGMPPKWITREMHEAIMNRFNAVVNTEMRAHTVSALQVVHRVMNDDTTDNRGKSLVAPGTKLDAAKFLIEHQVGKPTQRVETDISVKLQGLLAHATVGPGSMQPPDQPLSISQYAKAFADDSVIDAEEIDDDDDE